MSLLERQLFRVTNDPEADKAFAAAQEENRKAREHVVTEFQKIGDALRKKETPGLEADKKLLRDMVLKEQDKVRESKMTAAEVAEYTAGKQMLEIQNFKESLTKRAEFVKYLADQRAAIQKQIDDLNVKGTPIPPSLNANLKRIDSSTAWYDKLHVGSDPIKYDDELVSLKADLKAGNAEAKRKTEEYEDSREEFSIRGIFTQAIGIASNIVGVFLIFAFGVFGASLATNLNVYKPAAFRILYAIYGFLFFYIVIPYVLLYRWWWLGKRPRFYALIPLMGKRFDNHLAGVLLGWMSFKPDDVIESLKEWE
jgi:hypothetical protein